MGEFLKELKFGSFWDSQGEVERASDGVVRLKDGKIELLYNSGIRLSGEVIHGRLDNGAKVTLWPQDYPPYRPYGFPEPLDKARWLTHVLVGDWCSSKNEAMLNKITISYDHLSAWFLDKQLILNSNEFPAQPSCSIRGPFEVEEPIKVRLLDPPILERIEDSGGARVGFSRFPGRGAALELSVDGGLPYAKWDQIEHSLARFIGFNYGMKLDVKSRHYTVSGLRDNLEVFYLSHMRPPVRRTHVSDQHLIIPGSDLSPERALEVWFDALTSLYPVPQILASTEFQRGAPLESTVLAAIAGLEKMHEYMGFEQERFASETFDFLRDRIVDAARTDAAVTEQVDGVANYLNQVLQNRKTLRSRLKEIASLFTPEAFEALGFRKEEWINGVVAVRNNIAHSGSHVKKPTGTGANKLYDVNFQSRAILKLLLRIWMGLEVPDPSRMRLMFSNRPISQSGV